MSLKNYEITIWLEVHVRIKSKTKMFCNCKNCLELSEEANSNVCPICMWFPWMLPNINKEVIKLWLIWWMMMNCKINKKSRFDRKTYFYPDNPLSYQITQMYEPIVWNWIVKVLINWEIKEFSIHHMHLENDAWKLTHVWWKTLMDFNRAWSPLMEIVTDPVFTNKEEVMEFLKELQKMFRASWVSDADMEKWQMRCDVNISIRPFWQKEYWVRTEIKNVNSFSAIWRVIDFEANRQFLIINWWWKLKQETRWWDDEAWISKVQRTKEDAMDYRYFPEPDLLPLILEDDFIEECKKKLPVLPLNKRIKYLNEFNLLEDDARILSENKDLSYYFDETVELTKDPKKSCSYLNSFIFALMKESYINDIKKIKIKSTDLAKIINMVNKNELSSTNAKIIIEEIFKNWWVVEDIAKEKNLIQKNDINLLESIVNDVLDKNKKQLEEYKSWKLNLFWFFVWQCMKLSKWSWNPKIFNDILKEKLK